MTPAQFCFRVWHAHSTLRHGERPTCLHVKIARLLARWQHRMPSHGKLARAAGCCVRTVQNALNRLRRLGLLNWRCQGMTLRSGRRLQLPNLYAFDASFLTSCPLLHLGKLPESGRPLLPVRTVAQQIAWLMAH
jgi:DNA-binding transcriptional MocR family regulator